MKKIQLPALLASFVIMSASCTNSPTEEASDQVKDPQHSIIYYQEGRFAGWPANNGAAIFDGDEILVGFTEAAYAKTDGHNAEKPFLDWLARSTDGGLTWTAFNPDHYAGDFGDNPELKTVDTAISFNNPGFVMRVVASGYHGADDPRSHFLYSYDTGKSWQGPYSFGDLLSWPELTTAGLDELTPRTDYVVEGDKECLLVFSARKRGVFASDRLFAIKTNDGGKSFQFQGWIVGTPDMPGNEVKVNLFEDASQNPGANECRAVMSQTVKLDNGNLVTVIRRKFIAENKEEYHWIDAYHSSDNGKTWSFLAKIADTGAENGNPPAMATTADGRLCVVYGERDHGTIRAIYSADNGKTWGPSQVIMDGFWSEDMQLNDLGYPRVVRRSDGKMVAMYYYSTEEHPHHLRATIWEP